MDTRLWAERPVPAVKFENQVPKECLKILGDSLSPPISEAKLRYFGKPQRTDVLVQAAFPAVSRQHD